MEVEGTKRIYVISTVAALITLSELDSERLVDGRGTRLRRHRRESRDRTSSSTAVAEEHQTGRSRQELTRFRPQPRDDTATATEDERDPIPRDRLDDVPAILDEQLERPQATSMRHAKPMWDEPTDDLPGCADVDDDADAHPHRHARMRARECRQEHECLVVSRRGTVRKPCRDGELRAATRPYGDSVGPHAHPGGRDAAPPPRDDLRPAPEVEGESCTTDVDHDAATARVCHSERRSRRAGENDVRWRGGESDRRTAGRARRGGYGQRQCEEHDAGEDAHCPMTVNVTVAV